MTYIPDWLRQQVFMRANGSCEYCLVAQQDSFITHEIDHVIAEKHRGTTTEDNLCLSCYDCNRHKGSDLASIDPLTGDLVALFHPRRDRWSEHFFLDGAIIKPRTPQGRVTVFLLHLNDDNRIEDRANLIRGKRYPPPELPKNG